MRFFFLVMYTAVLIRLGALLPQTVFSSVLLCPVRPLDSTA